MLRGFIDHVLAIQYVLPGLEEYKPLYVYCRESEFMLYVGEMKMAAIREEDKHAL